VAEAVASLKEAMSKRQRQPIKKAEWRPIPPSLEEAFAEIERLDVRHPENRGINLRPRAPLPLMFSPPHTDIMAKS